MTERRVVAIRGIVQGVGFRPFIRDLAASHDLSGQVHNDLGGVVVDVEGPGASIEAFLAQLQAAPPPLAVIDSISVDSAPPAFRTGFTVAQSDASGAITALVAADAATCDACLDELFTPTNRRFRHPFITCTNCGPRFTIVTGMPYDRHRTTMASFPMCAACHREYHDVADRRHHAQPIACPDCGPVLGFQPAGARQRSLGAAALAAAATMLREGKILAIKGLGGYHLCCDATADVAVQTLRVRKRREARPLAIMVRDLNGARKVAQVSDAEATLLASAARPIVLLRRRPGSDLGGSVAPGLPTVGLLLAYTPIHHLLLAELDRPLVMTSGNRSEEPIAHLDHDALDRLGGIADGFLLHDRPIATRCDDSVAQMVAGGCSIIRRSRGFAPQPIGINPPFPLPILALGGHLKNTFCLGRDGRAFLSHHVGDLHHPSAVAALAEGVDQYQRLFGITPRCVAHDLHPDYASTRLAETLNLPVIGVQHHHAHVASCQADQGWGGPVLGVVFDGSGAGTDGAVWGGEFLRVEGSTFQRLGHLAYVPLPGGEAAVREPWRMAVAHLMTSCGTEAEGAVHDLVRCPPDQWGVLRQMLTSGFRSPPTSSVGRLFDAAAALLGLRTHAGYEAQAAIELEAAADPATTRSYGPLIHEQDGMLVADPGAVIRGLVEDRHRNRPVAEMAGAFHNAIRDLTVAMVTRLSRETGIRHVALTGGVFQNTRLVEGTAEALTRAGCTVLLHRRIPCNDGGLALGQAVVAAGQFAQAGG